MGKIKLSIFGRGRALVLLRKGKSIDETVDILRQRYNSNYYLTYSHFSSLK